MSVAVIFLFYKTMVGWSNMLFLQVQLSIRLGVTYPRPIKPYYRHLFLKPREYFTPNRTSIGYSFPLMYSIPMTVFVLEYNWPLMRDSTGVVTSFFHAPASRF